MPLIADLMHTALVDVPLAAFCFAVFYLVAMALTNEGGEKCNPVRCFFIAGVFLGFAMSVKYNGLLVAAAWFIVLFITLLFKGLRELTRHIILTALNTQFHPISVMSLFSGRR